MGVLVLWLFIVNGFTVDLDKTIELHYLSLCYKQVIGGGDVDIDSCLLNLRISHLTGNGALPDEFVEALFLSRSLYLCLIHIGGTDGFVGLLGTFGIGMILACLAILFSIEIHNLLLAGT